jgi:uncharacterized protein (UPF0335 family)
VSGKGLFRVCVKFAGVRVSLDGGVELFGIKCLEPGAKPRQLARGELLNGFLDILGGSHGHNIAFTQETEKSAQGRSADPVGFPTRALPGLTHWLFVCGHFHDLIQQGVIMSDVTIPGGRIRSFVERIENIDTELQELSEQKKEVFSEAKGEGFDVKILKEIIKLRKEDKEERDERESLLDL